MGGVIGTLGSVLVGGYLWLSVRDVSFEDLIMQRMQGIEMRPGNKEAPVIVKQAKPDETPCDSYVDSSEYMQVY